MGRARPGFVVATLAIGAWVGLILICVVAAGCPKPPPHPVRPDADGAPAATCVDACTNVEHLGCNTSSRCARDCERLQSQALINCIATAPSCAAADQCDR